MSLNNYKQPLKFFGLMIIAMVSWFLLFSTIDSQRKEARKHQESIKDKMVFIEKNSLGCSKFSYNGDLVWKCPKGLDISGIEELECTANRYRGCRTVFYPALKSNF